MAHWQYLSVLLQFADLVLLSGAPDNCFQSQARQCANGIELPQEVLGFPVRSCNKALGQAQKPVGCRGIDRQCPPHAER